MNDKERQIEEAFKKALEQRLDNAPHELTAQERMPTKIAQKRKITGMSNFFVDAVHALAEAKHCSLREAASFVIAEIHKEHLKIEKGKEKFGPLPDEYDPRNDSSIVR